MHLHDENTNPGPIWTGVRQESSDVQLMQISKFHTTEKANAGIAANTKYPLHVTTLLSENPDLTPDSSSAISAELLLRCRFPLSKHCMNSLFARYRVHSAFNRPFSCSVNPGAAIVDRT